MTHGHAHDREVLERCLARPHRYLGMIGSKTKVAATLARLKEKGFAQEDLDRVHAPIGLPIGSQTPAEIAVSIMAELIRFNSDQR
jgi:xanthine dehydrogenase accessory factor